MGLKGNGQLFIQLSLKELSLLLMLPESLYSNEQLVYGAPVFVHLTRTESTKHNCKSENLITELCHACDIVAYRVMQATERRLYACCSSFKRV
jgi:hypothetical protein